MSHLKVWNMKLRPWGYSNHLLGDARAHTLLYSTLTACLSPLHYLLLTTHFSLLTILTTHYSLLLLTNHYSLSTHSLLCYSPIITHFSPTHCSATHHPLLTFHPLTAHHPPTSTPPHPIMPCHTSSTTSRQLRRCSSSPNLRGCPQFLSSAHATRPTPPSSPISRQRRRCPPSPGLCGRLHLLSPTHATRPTPLTSAISRRNRRCSPRLCGSLHPLSPARDTRRDFARRSSRAPLPTTATANARSQAHLKRRADLSQPSTPSMGPCAPR